MTALEEDPTRLVHRLVHQAELAAARRTTREGRAAGVSADDPWDDAQLDVVARAWQPYQSWADAWDWLCERPGMGDQALETLGVMAAHPLSTPARLVRRSLRAGTPRQQVVGAAARLLDGGYWSDEAVQRERVRMVLDAVMADEAVVETFLRLARDGWNGTLEELVTTSVVLGAGG